MTVKAVLAKAHEELRDNPTIQHQLTEIQKLLDTRELPMKENTINFVSIQGIYDADKKSIFLISLFINNMTRPVNEIHAELRLHLEREGVQLATITLNFGKEFIGVLNPQEAMMIHLQIPARGLQQDEESFYGDEFVGRLEEVRVTFADGEGEDAGNVEETEE